MAPENLDAFARVRDAVSVPLAAGERVGTIFGARPLIERQLVDVIQPDTGRWWHYSNAKDCRYGRSARCNACSHSGSLGPVAEFAALHVMATVPNALLLEQIEFDWSGRYEVVQPILQSQDGELALPQSPGLGVSLVHNEIAKYPHTAMLQALHLMMGEAYVKGTADEAMHVQTRRARAARMRK